ncbi:MULTISPECIES: hypothetical protein [unclassified Streptomyces]|uniref:hypothetical protein n=1 Tax=unclassified Streptomyces TaxID=2593676 RepID=UPI002251051B|nr:MULTISPECIES: hypothetical protein [unclassified Streptomyces]WSP53232.1 hypothetical protein OG306_01450 [Streptomyces sp. NBC_01241]MCX4792085.1 hypothetical protein [Streptomyces sp. NBC_01221]MCX4799997.1 hypothetical protein [Streptomyces sp. NBC_01242]WSJ40611.1 hypothetical protein OG772_34785 [Streptomyces sp. NBC_01321]WSP66932.1 hypothetical protein OG466_37530 [Streptomyces sp. NBC_01240]
MNSKPKPLRPSRNRRSLNARHWIARRRRVIAANILRGACYGMGTGAVGLVFWWIEQRL